MSQLLTRVGPGTFGDGTQPSARATRTSSMVIQQASGKYREAMLRGALYASSIGAAGQAVGTAIGTTEMLTLYNPKASGRTLVLLGIGLGYVSGTLGAGTVVLVGLANTTQTAPTGGTSITPTNTLIGSANSSVALTGLGQTVVTGATLLREITSLFAELATTATAMQSIWIDVEGAYGVLSGARLGIQAVAGGGTNPVLTGSFLWEEVPAGQE